MIINCDMKYWRDPARIIFARYANNRTAIKLVSPEDGESIAVATVNLPDVPIGPDEAAIKDYSENEGMARVLIDAGLIEPEADRWLRSGFVTVGVYRLTSKAIGERARQERYAEQR